MRARAGMLNFFFSWFSEVTHLSSVALLSLASRRSGAPHPLSSSLALAEPQLAEASILSLRVFLVSQPSLILQFVEQKYPSWWTTCRGLFEGVLQKNLRSKGNLLTFVLQHLSIGSCNRTTKSAQISIAI